MLDVGVIPCLVKAQDKVDVSVCSVKLIDDHSIVPFLVRWLYQCVVVLWVFVGVVVLVKSGCKSAACVNSGSGRHGDVCNAVDVVFRSAGSESAYGRHGNRTIWDM